MKRNLVSVLATVGLLACASAYAWIDPGVFENYNPTQPQALSFEQEMRDLRRAIYNERSGPILEDRVTVSFEQEAQDLRRALVRGRVLAPSRTGDAIAR